MAELNPVVGRSRVQPAFEEVVSFRALFMAAQRAARGKRAAPQTAAFLMDLERELFQLERELLLGTYRPQAYRTFTISFPKPRTISAAHFRDRVVHHALCAMLEPIFEREAIADSYACRPGKGGLRALRRAQAIARQWRYVLRLDVLHYFETVDHQVLLERLHARLEDGRVHRLAEIFVRAGAPGSPPGKGLPIGNLTSQHFANFLLSEVDRAVIGAPSAPGYVRYLDDFAVFGDDKAELWRLHDQVEAQLEGALRLRLKARATVLVPVTEGFPFLGFRVWPRLVRFDGRRARRYRAAVRRILRALDRGGLGEDDAVRSMRALEGWARQASTLAFRRSFEGRLRSDRGE